MGNGYAGIGFIGMDFLSMTLLFLMCLKLSKSDLVFVDLFFLIHGMYGLIVLINWNYNFLDQCDCIWEPRQVRLPKLWERWVSKLELTISQLFQLDKMRSHPPSLAKFLWIKRGSMMRHFYEPIVVVSYAIQTMYRVIQNFGNKRSCSTKS